MTYKATSKVDEQVDDNKPTEKRKLHLLNIGIIIKKTGGLPPNYLV